MVLSELIQRSPIRIFERSIHGGLKPGETGIIASQNGLGKTSVLVQLALDKLLQGKKVIHISFTRPNTVGQHTHYVLAWYENIFDEFISPKHLDNTAEVKDNAVKNRVLMNFNQETMSSEKIISSLRALIAEGSFKADAVIIDGFDFSRTDGDCDMKASISGMKTFAREFGLSVWYSCSLSDNNQQLDEKNIPVLIKDFSDLLDIVILLEPRADHIRLSVSKDRDSRNTNAMAMRLDPKTLLILEE